MKKHGDMKEVLESMFSVDKRPPLGGWCHGYYTCICTLCDREFSGAKRSYQCADCAYKLADRKDEEKRTLTCKLVKDLRDILEYHTGSFTCCKENEEDLARKVEESVREYYEKIRYKRDTKAGDL